MENMELNEVITTDAVEDIAETIPTGNSGLKSSAIIGLSMAAGAAIWELGIKPVGRKALGWLAARKAARKNKAKSETTDETPEEPEEETK